MYLSTLYRMCLENNILEAKKKDPGCKDIGGKVIENQN